MCAILPIDAELDASSGSFLLHALRFQGLAPWLFPRDRALTLGEDSLSAADPAASLSASTQRSTNHFKSLPPILEIGGTASAVCALDARHVTGNH
eukprot:4452110-Amphidinium_carterae.4